MKEERASLFNIRTLKRTIIKGIPCSFLTFRKIELESVGLGDNLSKDKEHAYECVGPEQGSNEINLRAKVWAIVTDLDSVK